MRPEKILAPGEATANPTATVPVEVEVLEPLGSEVIVHGRAGDALLVASFEPHRAPAVGSHIDLVLDLTTIQLFESESGRRLTA